ncbi:glutathione S-transferase T3-like [Raphanus sativus]|uniref:Glutathione S-transferase T3-like n=1 Tax=Raphanus sativus TaxID=3726 RepID=A0A6J0LZQ7_RAPSA|nr:glutathione S-transferase T3-like [Raphanus sativus]
MDSTNPDMDSTNSYSQYRSNYVGLLTSQGENVVFSQENFQTFPFESFPSSVGEPDIPPFSSQHSEAPAVTEDTPPVARERKKWTPADDEVLISAWLNTSKDPIVANEQKMGTFWRRVEAYYAASPHVTQSGGASSHKNLKQRWSKINGKVNKFCGAYAAAERRQTSGQNENDVLKEAHVIYFKDYNTKFTLEHAWCILRYEQKWMCLNTNATGKRKTTDVHPQASSATASASASVDVDEHEKRPEGIKAAKARRNNAKGKSFEEYKDMCSLKMVDLAQKEKLCKLSILDTLLAKKDSLTEAEEIVKDKLLAQYF